MLDVRAETSAILARQPLLEVPLSFRQSLAEMKSQWRRLWRRRIVRVSGTGSPGPELRVKRPTFPASLHLVTLHSGKTAHAVSAASSSCSAKISSRCFCLYAPLSPAMIDLHCHILPGVDDGATSWETAAEMYRIAAGDGIRHLVATPHANDRYAYDRAQCELLLEQLKTSGHGLDFSLGCDFHCSFENIEDAVLRPYLYTIGTSSYLLVEFSNFAGFDAMGQALFRLASTGLVPILTHPERNMVLLERPEKVLDLVGQGCLIQVTAGSFTGAWGGRSQTIAEWLLKKEAIDLVATDAHDPVHRPPVLSKAFDRVSKLAGLDTAEQLFVENPGAIVSASHTLLGR